MKILKKALLAALVVVTYITATYNLAAAHTQKITTECGLIQLDLRSYDEGSKVTVEVDGQAYDTVTFTTVRLAYLLTDTEAHTWKVTIDNRGDGLKRSDPSDAVFSGSLADCTEPPATTTPPKPTVPPAPPTTVEPAGPTSPVLPSAPATPICSVPGLGTLDAADPACVFPAHPVELAITGADRVYATIVAGMLLLGFGVLLTTTYRVGKR